MINFAKKLYLILAIPSLLTLIYKVSTISMETNAYVAWTVLSAALPVALVLALSIYLIAIEIN